MNGILDFQGKKFGEKLRIGIICHSSCGGSSRIAFELARQLARRNHQVHLFSQRIPFGFSLTPVEANLVTHFFPTMREDAPHPAQLKTAWNQAEQEQFIASLIEVIEGEGLDVLHFHYALPFAFLVAELKRRLGNKSLFLVGTLHGTDVSIFGREPEYANALKEALGQLDFLTTVSTSHAQLAEKLLGIKPPPVIPNFIDLADYPIKSSPTRKLGEPSRLIHISNFRSVKAPREMLEIFARISREKEAELWLVGDGPGLEELKPLFEKWGLNGRIRLWGLQEKVAPILLQTDLLLMTSLAESFCLVALEALVCGVPVLATSVGGLPELVRHGETGYLFSVGDQAKAVKYGLQLLTNQVLYSQFSAAGRAQAHRFDQTHIIRLYEEVYFLSKKKISI